MYAESQKERTREGRKQATEGHVPIERDPLSRAVGLLLARKSDAVSTNGLSITVYQEATQCPNWRKITWAIHNGTRKVYIVSEEVVL